MMVDYAVMVESKNYIIHTPCNHGGVKELLYTPRTIMVEYRDFGISSRKAYWTLGRSALCLFAQKCRAMVES